MSQLNAALALSGSLWPLMSLWWASDEPSLSRLKAITDALNANSPHFIDILHTDSDDSLIA